MVNERELWRKKRREKEITLTEIAAFVGCSSQHLNQWEKKSDYSVSTEVLAGYMYYIENDLHKKK